eukprot:TRINITY_DN80950_c0_g1_i1.p2 TRINITY_DN80950_c0_g1~~TRINITY_DN80950_c0_g1_i1.p2  ORF type:complete len:185 (+),score=41.11 TRINITY_DN80950_c0_g1_i1:90-644(+)
MLVPMVNPVQPPPTPFALKMKPVFVGLLVMQFILIGARFFIMDMWGAMLTMLVLITGTFVLTGQGGLDTTFCMYYCFMCLVNGVFDVILCVERWVHVKYMPFSRQAPVMYNVASFVFLLSPIVEITAAMVAAAIYLDAQEEEARAMRAYYAFDYGAVLRSGGMEPGGRSDRSGFVPFQGRCEKL